MLVASRRLIAVLLPLAIAVGVLWPLLAPRAQCYAPEGECLFFAAEFSNVFFRIDATFALLAVAAGVLSGFLLNRAWLARGFRYQVLAALSTTGFSVLIVTVVEHVITPVTLAGSKPEFLDNVFVLGSPSALLVWAFAQQLTFAITGPKLPPLHS
jgi:hypothetical protein